MACPSKVQWGGKGGEGRRIWDSTLLASKSEVSGISWGYSLLTN